VRKRKLLTFSGKRIHSFTLTPKLIAGYSLLFVVLRVLLNGKKWQSPKNGLAYHLLGGCSDGSGGKRFDLECSDEDPDSLAIPASRSAWTKFDKTFLSL
jgi:hypothetical protein